MIINIFAFIIVIGVLVFVHEFGHFIVAKLCGIGVEKFSIGFGPKILGFRRGITDYYISAIPLGGYVKMLGDNEGVIYDNSLINFSFLKKNVFKKIFVVLAGPVLNLFFAVFVFFIIFCFYGIVILKPNIGDVIKDMPASKCGIKKGDRIIAINNTLVLNWEDMVNEISKEIETCVSILYISSGYYYKNEIDTFVTTSRNTFENKTNKYIIGVIPSKDIVFKKIKFLNAFSKSFTKTYEFSCLTTLSIFNIFRGYVSIKNIGGPIMIAEMVSYSAKQGVVNLLFFVGLLSINLAILNCLPIPILDGGHLVFFIYEALFGRSLNFKIKEKTQQVGLLFLFIIMLYVFLNDIVRVLK